MQRRATRNTRGPNADEKRFAAKVKECDCIVCGNPGPSIVHHAMGATFKHNKVLVGHWFLLPLCQSCDDVITQGSRSAFVSMFGPQSEYWLRLVYLTGVEPPHEVVEAIKDWGQ